LKSDGPGWKSLRQNGRNFGLPRFVGALEKAAMAVASARPGAVLVVGDLSAEHGGMILPHLSHRSGRDADLLFYATTLDGTPVPPSEFVHFGPDGLGWDSHAKQFLRFDVERQWLLVRHLLTDDQARVQWVFVNQGIRAMLLEWAAARGEPMEVLYRASIAMSEPHPGGAHDDHIHVRTACDDDDLVRGCEWSGPDRSWIATGLREGPSKMGVGREVEDWMVALAQPIQPGPNAVATDRGSMRPVSFP
jgi:penicillin-insensitive murein endopeptidase